MMLVGANIVFNIAMQKKSEAELLAEFWAENGPSWEDMKIKAIKARFWPENWFVSDS